MPLVQPKWPIEPAILFVVTYYATNAEDAEPVSTQNNLRTYESALSVAQSLITNAGNVGVCTIQPVSTSIVFPAVEWEDF